MNEIKPQKLDMEKNISKKEKLKLFLFLYYSPPVVVPPGLQVCGTLAYEINEAIDKTRRAIPAGNNITYTRNYILVDTILNQIGEQKVSSLPQIKLEVKKGLPELKAGLTMLVEEYIKDEEDKRSIKRIIEKIE